MPPNKALSGIAHININNDSNSNHSLPKMESRERMTKKSKDSLVIRAMAAIGRTTFALPISQIAGVTLPLQ